MNNYNSFLIALLDSLNKSNIIYCILRNYRTLPYTTNGSDLDIWVSSSSITSFINILKEVNKNSICSLVSYVDNKYCPKYCFQNNKEGIQIDIFVGNIYFQNKKMIDEDSIKNNIVSYNGIRVLEDKFANLISLIKEITNNGKCKYKFITPIYTYKDFYSKEYLESNLLLFRTEFISLLYRSINESTIKENVHELTLLGRKSISSKVGLFLYGIKKTTRLLSLRPGYVIAILGTDGSGKSTIINNITPILNEGFHNGIIYNHLRPNVIPDLGVVMGKKEKKEDVNVVSNPHAEKQSGFMKSIVRWGYYMIDYTLGYLKAVYPVIHSKSKIFIFDRYYYDYYIDQKRSKTNLPNWVLKFGEFFVPRPDITLCLGGDPEKIYNRKPETSLEEVTRQTNALKEFCKNHKNAVWIDTCTDIQTSTDEAMNAICDMMAKRFSNFKFK